LLCSVLAWRLHQLQYHVPLLSRRPPRIRPHKVECVAPPIAAPLCLDHLSVVTVQDASPVVVGDVPYLGSTLPVRRQAPIEVSLLDEPTAA
jgi:hypothetical protein